MSEAEAAKAFERRRTALIARHKIADGWVTWTRRAARVSGGESSAQVDRWLNERRKVETEIAAYNDVAEDMGWERI